MGRSPGLDSNSNMRNDRKVCGCVVRKSKLFTIAITFTLLTTILLGCAGPSTTPESTPPPPPEGSMPGAPPPPPPPTPDTKLQPEQSNDGTNEENKGEVLPLEPLPIAINVLPMLPLAAGEPVTVTNPYFEVSLISDSYVYFKDFQIVFLWARVKNLGDREDRFDFELTSAVPDGWDMVNSDAGHIWLGPDEEGDLKYMWSAIYTKPIEEEVQSTFTYQVRSNERRETLNFTTTIVVHPGIAPVTGGVTNSATVRGTVKDAVTGNPVSEAEVSLWLGYTIRLAPFDTLSMADTTGSYNLSCWSVDKLNSHYAPHFTVPGYRLVVQKDGYETYVYDGYVRPQYGSPISFDINLTPLENPVDFELKWQTTLASPGVFKIAVADAWDRFAVAMGKHPDPDDPAFLPAEIPLIDGEGNIMWSKSIPDQSWAVDITGDGSRVACTTESVRGSNYCYLWDADGQEIWAKSIPGHSIEIKFSQDNQYVATGPASDGSQLVLYNSRTGAEEWKYHLDDKNIRAAAFTRDGQYILAGGLPHLFSMDGDLIWRGYMAYTPYVIIPSSDGSRIMVADKGDCLSMFDGDGNLLWRKDHKVITYGAMSADGSVVVILTTHGYVYCYNGEGEIQWASYLRGDGNYLTAGVGGHNAVDITSDGKYIVVGGTNYSTVLFDSAGNVLWRHNGSTPYISRMVGGGLKQSVMAVRISEDGTKIVSGYGTGDPRICYFEKE